MTFKLRKLSKVQFNGMEARSQFETHKAYTEFCDEKFIGFSSRAIMLKASRRGVYVKVGVRI